MVTAMSLPGAKQESDLSVRKIKILTVNMHKGFNAFNRRFTLHELRDALREINPDVVFLQEVLGEHRQFATRYTDLWPEQSQYEFLADQVWSAHAYGRNAVYPHGHHGNALLSRFPIDRWHNHDISLSGIEKRGLLYCHLDLGEQKLHAICVHLSLRESHRLIQLKRLSKLVNSLPADEPVVVAGDFNDWRLKAENLLFNESRLVDAYTGHRGKPARSFPVAMPMLRLDRIYLRRNSRYEIERLHRSPWSRISDHKPLMVELDIQE